MNGKNGDVFHPQSGTQTVFSLKKKIVSIGQENSYISNKQQS